MAEAGIITRTVVFRVAAPVGSNILAAARAAAGRAESAAGATADDVVATAAGRVATGLDRVATGQDRDATGQDRSATGQDRIAASVSAGAAAASVPVTADRTVGRRLNDSAIWPLLRSTKTWDVGPDGSIAEAAPDTIVWGFDPAALSPRGMQFQGARTNGAVYSRGEGAVVGTPGTLPTGWSWQGALPAGVSYAVTALGTSGAVSYIRMQLSGTAGASTSARLHFGIGTGSLAAVSGDIVAPALYVGLPAGGALPSGISGISVGARGLAANGSTNTEGVANGPNLAGILTTAALSTQRTVGAGTLGNASTAFVVPYLTVAISSGSAVSADLLIGFPTIEKAAFASSLILPLVGTPAPTPRSQSTVDIPIAQLGTRWNRRQGIMLVDWASQPGAFTSANDADWLGLISWGNGTANERLGLLVNPAHTSVEARVTAGGVVQSAASRAMAAPTAGQTIRCAVAWDLDAGFLQVAARGAAGTKVALTALPVPGWILPGRYATSHPLFGWISGAEVRPAALFDAALAALT